ncbi:MAG: hypothetical protein WBE34_12130 [Candidatus Nitrosopolaris sp.]
MNKHIFLVAGIVATLGVMATGFLNSQVQAVPKICAGNPHDRDSSSVTPGWYLQLDHIFVIVL